MLTKTGAKLLDFGLAKAPAVGGASRIGAHSSVVADGRRGRTSRRSGEILGHRSSTWRRNSSKGTKPMRVRHLRVRRRALRDAHRQESIRGKEPGASHRIDHVGRHRSGFEDRARDAPCARLSRHPCLAKDRNSVSNPRTDIVRLLQWITVVRRARRRQLREASPAREDCSARARGGLAAGGRDLGARNRSPAIPWREGDAPRIIVPDMPALERCPSRPTAGHILYHVFSGSVRVLTLRRVDQLNARPDRRRGRAECVLLARQPVDRFLRPARSRLEKDQHRRGVGDDDYAARPSMNGASWGDDDTIVFADGTGQRGLFRVPAAGGTGSAAARDRDGQG